MNSVFRDVRIGRTTADLQAQSDGSQVLRVREPLGAYPDTLLERFRTRRSRQPIH